MTFCKELNLKFFRKLIKYFMYFRTKFALFFRFFHSWYIIKYLLTETSGKQYVLWTLDCRCFPRLRLGKHRQSRVHKTYCFPRSQSISVKCCTSSIAAMTSNANHQYTGCPKKVLFRNHSIVVKRVLLYLWEFE